MCQVTVWSFRSGPGEQPLPDGQREREDRVRAHGERDGEVPQAAPGGGRVLGGVRGAADHHEQVGSRSEQDGGRLAARRPQAAEFARAGTICAGAICRRRHLPR